MRKESNTLTVVLLIILVLLGSVYILRVVRTEITGGQARSERAAGTIIKCYDRKIGAFYSDAVNCDEADPSQAIPIDELPEGTPARDR